MTFQCSLAANLPVYNKHCTVLLTGVRHGCGLSVECLVFFSLSLSLLPLGFFSFFPTLKSFMLCKTKSFTTRPNKLSANASSTSLQTVKRSNNGGVLLVIWGEKQIAFNKYVIYFLRSDENSALCYKDMLTSVLLSWQRRIVHSTYGR